MKARYFLMMVTLGASTAMAQQGTMPPMNVLMPEDSPPPWTSPLADDEASSMHMTPGEMRNMPATAVPDAPRETHVPDLGLEHPAASERQALPMMAGMDTDMNDAAIEHFVWLENVEGVHGIHNGGAWDAQAWAGGDFDKLWIKSEGTMLGGKTQDSKVEALWAHAVLPVWDTQLGVRHDFSGGPSREWAAFGVQGISPYWFDVELTGYIGEEGRTAVRLKTEYDLYLSERLILKPEIELNAYGKPDRARNIGAGLSDGQFELRLRYEVSRRFAPYVGYRYDRQFAGTADIVRLAGGPAVDHRTVAGVQLFF